jgi:hypothetical protein
VAVVAAVWQKHAGVAAWAASHAVQYSSLLYRYLTVLTVLQSTVL